MAESNNDIKEIGKRIHRLRKQLDMNQEKFAKYTGAKAKGNVSHWEKGRALPNMEQLTNISRLCKVTIDFIITGEKDTENKIINELRQEVDRLEREKHDLLDQVGNVSKIAENIRKHNDINNKRRNI